jgi:CheY-like chemotaxis protein
LTQGDSKLHASTDKSAACAAPGRAVLKALVVDDDPFQSEVLADILRDIGPWSVTFAENGKAALRELAESKTGPAFDLTLCDLHMPAMDGFQFMSAVEQGGYLGALIIVSGQSGEVQHSASLVAQLQRFEFLGLLPKPVEKRALAALISRLR